MVHILVVDDDEKLNKTICKWLNDCGFAAKGVLNAGDTFEEMYNSLYSLIISDIMMPEMDGFEFAKKGEGSKTNIFRFYLYQRRMTCPPSRRGSSWELMITWSNPSNWQNLRCGYGRCSAGPILRWSGSLQ